MAARLISGYVYHAPQTAGTLKRRRCCLAVAIVVAAAVLGRQVLSFVPAPMNQASRGPLPDALAVPLLGGAAALVAPAEALAKNGQWGPFEGKASSLVHPLVEGILFLLTLYTGWLGWQVRQLRFIGGDINEVKKSIKAHQSKAEKVDIAEGVSERIVSPEEEALHAELKELNTKRSELTSGKFRNRHYAISATLLGAGTFFTCYGIFNTFFRAEKLFPGPHLYAGAAIVVLWALGAALVPAMEKGSETARNAHIAIATTNVGLFCWQLPTGWEILGKVWGNQKLAWFPAFAAAAVPPA